MADNFFFLHPEDEQEFEELILTTLVLVKLFRSPSDLAICSEIVKLTLIERWRGPGLLREVAEKLRMDYGMVRQKLSRLRPAVKRLLARYYSIENTADRLLNNGANSKGSKKVSQVTERKES